MVFFLLGLDFAIFYCLPLEQRTFLADLDPSWVFVMNDALFRHLKFGTDLIFTFGPLGFLYNEFYHPQLFMAKLGFCVLFVSVFYSVVQRTLRYLGVSSGMAMLGALLMVTGSQISQDIGYFLILLFSVILYSQRLKEWKKFETGLFLVLQILLGTFVLIKGSFLFPILALEAYLGVLHFRNLRIWLMMTVFPLTTLTLGAFLGYSPTDVLRFFVSLGPVIAGYSEAMVISSQGSFGEIFLILGSTGYFGWKVLSGLKFDSKYQKFGILLIGSILVWCAAKAGFVRHDAHSTIPASLAGSLVLTYLLVNTKKNGRDLKRWKIVMLALLVFYIPFNSYRKHYDFEIKTPFERFFHRVSYQVSAILEGSHQLEILESNDQAAKAAARAKINLPELTGPTDILSFHQYLAFISNFDYQSRPVYQGYSVFNSKLAEINRNFYLGEKSPQNVIFDIFPIDRRWPATEEGFLWSILLENYHPIFFEDRFLILTKNKSPEALNLVAFPARTLQQGESLSVDTDPGLYFLKLKFEKTIFGKLLTTAFKSPVIEVTLEMKDGNKIIHRLIPGLAESEFLLSPYVNSSGGFARIYEKKVFSDADIVKSVAVENSIWSRLYYGEIKAELSFSKTWPAQSLPKEYLGLAEAQYRQEMKSKSYQIIREPTK